MYCRDWKVTVVALSKMLPAERSERGKLLIHLFESLSIIPHYTCMRNLYHVVPFKYTVGAGRYVD